MKLSAKKIVSLVAAFAVALTFASVATAQTSSSPMGEELLPPNAQPGECYARVWVPPKYSTATETVLKKDAGERLEVVPAKYEWATEKVLVKPATTRIEIVPAKYETITERVLDRPAHTVWKKGSYTGAGAGAGAGVGSGNLGGKVIATKPVDGSAESTGEIMCLVEVPATYKTVTKRVQKAPATTREVTIPAEYKTIKVQREAQPATVRRVTIPAEYQTVTKTALVNEGGMAWMPVLCQTNATGNVVSQLQASLQRAGYNPGATDGVIGTQTLRAVERYQKAKGLARGGITLETLKSLGVKF